MCSSDLVLGQVCCDSNGKLNVHSVLLEAGPDQGGQQVPVDLSELREYSLFPGQVKDQLKHSAVVVSMRTLSELRTSNLHPSFPSRWWLWRG